MCVLTKKCLILVLIMLYSAKLLHSQIIVTGAAAASNGTYSKLSQAFTAINNQVQTNNNITIRITSQPLEETASCILNPGTWSSMLIYPTVSGITIYGSPFLPLIELSGADNVTFDGRVNLTGSADMTIVNYITGTSRHYSVFRFTNGACNNTIRYCTLKGGATSASSGIVDFSSGTLVTENYANIIEYNNFTGLSDSLRPTFCISSISDPDKYNRGHIIRYNKFYDFLNRSLTTAAIFASQGTRNITIHDNHIYETTPLVTTGNNYCYGIMVATTIGGTIVKNNYIGGSAPYCAGVFKKSGAYSNALYGIFLSAGAGDTNEVQGNVIKNISWEGTAANHTMFLAMGGGNYKIGTSAPNIIGSDTGNTSLYFKVSPSTTNYVIVYGMSLSSTGNTILRNNKIGGITIENGVVQYANSIFGLFKAGTGQALIENNVVGSTDTSTMYSLFLPSSTSIASQTISGIQVGGGNTIVRGNVVSKFGNMATGSNGNVVGIGALNGSATITGNTVSHLKNLSNNTAIGNYLSTTGIYYTISTGTYSGSISANTVSDIINANNTFTASVGGIFVKSAGMQIGVSGNLIHSIYATGSSASGSIFGIRINAGITSIHNNIIRLSGTTGASIYGIYENCAADNNTSLLFNTKCLTGTTNVITSKSYALYSGASTNGRDFRNNVLVNTRSTLGGSNANYSAFFNYGTSVRLTLDHNVYYTSGTGGNAGFFNSTNVNSLPLVNALDSGSYLLNPRFINQNILAPDGYIPQMRINGAVGTGITTDYFGITRKTIPTIGAVDSTFLTIGYINLQVIPEGYLDTTNNRLRKKDMVTLYLVNGTAPYTFVDSSKSVLDSITYTSKHEFSAAPDGQYYFVVRHTNSIETWSKDSTLQFAKGEIQSFDFTDAAEKAYNNNLKLKGGKYCLYTGDVNQDGYVDVSDVIQIDNTANSTPTVFTTEDLNGDGIVNYDDLLAIDANYMNFVQMYSPLIQ